MRFFAGVCVVCLLVASVGCMTDNWSKSLLAPIPALDGERVDRPSFFHQTFGKPSGTDARAREIEKSLGVGMQERM